MWNRSIQTYIYFIVLLVSCQQVFVRLCLTRPEGEMHKQVGAQAEQGVGNLRLHCEWRTQCQKIAPKGKHFPKRIENQKVVKR